MKSILNTLLCITFPERHKAKEELVFIFAALTAPVFGETGSYLARQIVADGIYGYRLYGNVSYFGAANVTIDSTIFCTFSDDEGNTTKFNSPGWSGSFGCPQDIDTIAFPTNNTALAGLT